MDTGAAHSKPRRSPAQWLSLLAAVIGVAVAVSLTYFYFEAAVRNTVNFIWHTALNTNEHRLLVVPAALVLGLIFFWLQHRLDPASETHQAHGLGQAPNPTLRNFGQVLFIGFMSLVAGASLGPEAILVPACIIIGAYAGSKFFSSNSAAPKLLGMVGFVALMAAFFDSFWFGLLGLLLVTKQVGVKLNAMYVAVGTLASLVTVLMLAVLESHAYAKLPAPSWHVSLVGILLMVVLVASGAGVNYAMYGLHHASGRLRTMLSQRPWWMRWLAASLGLSVLYLLGGPLVEFTGNESIQPMLQQAASLGVVGLAWLVVVKIAAISWSKSLSYRGGMVFPTLFVASVVVALAQQFGSHVSFTLGLIAVIVGAVAADRRTKVML